MTPLTLLVEFILGVIDCRPRCENAEPEIAFEVIELLPKVGMILTSTAGKDEGSFIFLVLCNNKDSVKMLDDVKIKYKEYT